MDHRGKVMTKIDVYVPIVDAGKDGVNSVAESHALFNAQQSQKNCLLSMKQRTLKFIMANIS